MSKLKGLKAPKASPTAIEPDQDDYKADSDFRTMLDAEQIKQDPDRMAKVHKRVGRHHKAIKSLQDLKDTYDEKYGSGALKKPTFGE